MASNNEFQWDLWYQRFYLPPEVLSNLWEYYPNILASRNSGLTDIHGEPNIPFSEAFINTFINDDPEIRYLTNFTHYLDVGELAAASILVTKAASENKAEPKELEKKIIQAQKDLMLEYGDLQAKLNKCYRTLANLRILGNDDASKIKSMNFAEDLFRLKRYGPALDILRKQVLSLQEKESEVYRKLQEKSKDLKVKAKEFGQNAIGLQKLFDEADFFLNSKRIELADHTIHRISIILESRDFSSIHTQKDEAEEILFRKDFPDVRSREILSYLEGRDINPTDAFKEFLLEWCPSEWKEGIRPSKENPNYNLYEALRDLSKLSSPGTSYPYSRKPDDPWRYFIRSFFTLIGKRGMDPKDMEDISIRKSRETLIGFWVGRCDKDLMIPYTFIDPKRLPNGLPIILWHRANDPTCPQPANLQNDLLIQGLYTEPLLFISGEQIAQEERDALNRAIPTATLLDERDLLQIIFCSDRPEVRAMHFAKAIAWQLPIEVVSPYSEQGEVISSMFVGRQRIIRDMLAPQGATVLYGGRKLGKSSIFWQLKRFFDSQSPEKNISVYINAINVVDGVSIEGTLLPNIVRALKPKLFEIVKSESVNSSDVWIFNDTQIKCDDFANKIRSILIAAPSHRFLLLIDEADSLLQFLDSPNDAAVSPAKRFGWTLRALVQESAGRFDVRFAGFQEINRAAQSPSGPFYNFRTGNAQLPLTVLEPEEARQLIITPLQIMGASFEEESLIDLIIEFTGKHPALIQEYCRRLYRNLRGKRRTNLMSINQDQVKAIWEEPEYRKSVVKAIHLNVETRNTRAEKVLRLLLYLWVYEIMVSNGYSSLPIVCETSDFYQLLVKRFGEEIISQYIKMSELDSYLSDLATLGVLEKTGRGYVFSYRYFASLLYYDYFNGQLDRDIDEVWSSIKQHEESSPRFEMPVSNNLSFSPFLRTDQSKFEQDNRYIWFVLGAPGTGKTEFFKWLSHTYGEVGNKVRTIKIYDINGKHLDGLKETIAKAFGLNHIKTLPDLSSSLNTSVKKVTIPHMVVFENADSLVEKDEGWSLISWPDTSLNEMEDGLLSFLSKLTRKWEGNTRFIFTGSLQLARFWVGTSSLLRDSCSYLCTQKLNRQECDLWLDTTRILAASATKKAIWDLSKGDWRLLVSLHEWLDKNHYEEPDKKHIQEFEHLVLEQGNKNFPTIEENLKEYDVEAIITYQTLAKICTEYETNEFDEDDLIEILVENFRQNERAPFTNWSPNRWSTEIQAGLLLQELSYVEHEDNGKKKIRIPCDEVWFQILTRNYE